MVMYFKENDLMSKKAILKSYCFNEESGKMIKMDLSLSLMTIAVF